MRVRIFALYIIAAIPTSAFCQPITISPLRTVDIRSAVIKSSGRKDFEIVGIAQSRGRWAVLVNYLTTKESIVVLGDYFDIKFSSVIDANADRIALDSNGIIYVRRRTTERGVSEVEVKDESLRTIGKHRITDSGLEPVVSGSEVLWRNGNNGDLLFRLHRVGEPVGKLRRSEEKNLWTPPEITSEPRLIFGLPSQRWVQLGVLSEEVAVRENDGNLVSRTLMALDDAYRLADKAVPRHDPLSGIARIGWAGVDRDGKVYVCLYSLPVAGPAYIAVIDPMTGYVLKVIAAKLPSAPERSDVYNPDGFMYPLSGTIDDHLIILDGPVGLLAVYALDGPAS